MAVTPMYSHFPHPYPDETYNSRGRFDSLKRVLRKTCGTEYEVLTNSSLSDVIEAEKNYLSSWGQHAQSALAKDVDAIIFEATSPFKIACLYIDRDAWRYADATAMVQICVAHGAILVFQQAREKYTIEGIGMSLYESTYDSPFAMTDFTCCPKCKMPLSFDHVHETRSIARCMTCWQYTESMEAFLHRLNSGVLHIHKRFSDLVHACRRGLNIGPMTLRKDVAEKCIQQNSIVRDFDDH